MASQCKSSLRLVANISRIVHLNLIRLNALAVVSTTIATRIKMPLRSTFYGYPYFLVYSASSQSAFWCAWMKFLTCAMQGCCKFASNTIRNMRSVVVLKTKHHTWILLKLNLRKSRSLNLNARQSEQATLSERYCRYAAASQN